MNNIFDIFLKFFTLGFISFGGPMAHIGYFRKTFVEKLNWLDDSSYSKILALSQFLPGPSSSQVGFAIGLKKGGLLGAFAAFIAFTAPSFIILYILAILNINELENSFIGGIIIGLKLFAVVIVTDATISMFKSFCKDRITIAIFAFCAVLLLLLPFSYTQILVIALGAFLGKLFIKNKNDQSEQKIEKTNKIPLFIFIVLLFSLPFLASLNDELKIFSIFYEAGSLVFGGGHVVLPLLENNLLSLVSKDEFLLGYSFAQAIPGPMFTIATYLGASALEQNALTGSLLATSAIFLPGFLLILAFYKSFESYSKRPKILSAIAGVNASVVALLFAVLISTVAPSAIYSFWDVLLALFGLVLLRVFKLSILYTILIFVITGIVENLLF